MSKILGFGLDIGSTSIKAVGLKPSGNSYELDFVTVAPSYEKGLLSESIIDKQQLADSIKKMLSDAGVKNQYVNIALPEGRVYTKIIEMPPMSEKELGSALRWEMEQYIPLPLDQVRTSFQILTDRGENGRMEIFLVAAPISLIDKYEKVLELAGLTIQTIETEIITVARALSPIVNVQSASIIVNIGASTSNIAVVKNGIPKAVYGLEQGGMAITRAIASDLNIDIAEAENYKKAYGLNQEAFEGKIGKSLNPILESIAGDIKKAMFSYKEKNNNDEVKQIVLSGGSVLLPGIDVFFTNALNTQVVIGRCWSSFNIKNIPDEIMQEGPSFNSVAGSALKDYID